MTPRRRSVLLALAVALAVALAPHPRERGEHFAAVAQEVHGVELEIVEAENTCISLMLLGSVGFMMATFYLVNWPDEDIRRISWEVISSTISVFGSLLLFQGCNRVLDFYIFHDLSILQQLAVGSAHMMLWFILLQLVLGYLSGALGSHPEVLQRHATLRMKLSHAEMHLHNIKLNTHAGAVLLGHTTGFAAVNAWSLLQQAVPHSFWWCGAIPPLSFLGIFLIYKVTDSLRHYKTMADGEEDEFEHMWGEHVAETEDEVISLTVSFLLVQMLRFCISGHLPDASGEDERLHSNLSCALLLLVGLVFGLSDVARLACRKQMARSTSGEEDRISQWIHKISAMCFAWCLHFATEWCIASNLRVEGSVKAVVAALAVTVFAFGFIFGLDKLADQAHDAELDRALRTLISALGMLVGFSWERSFDAALGGVSRSGFLALPAPVFNLLLAVALAILVLPAWKWYVLPGLLPVLERPALGAETRLFGRLTQLLSPPASPKFGIEEPAEVFQEPMKVKEMMSRSMSRVMVSNPMPRIISI